MEMRLLYLDASRVAQYVVHTSGDASDFADSPDWYILQEGEEAENFIGKRYDGTNWHEVEREEAPPTPPAPQAPTPEVALLEALAEQGESINDLKEQMLTLMEAVAEQAEKAE